MSLADKIMAQRAQASGVGNATAIAAAAQKAKEEREQEIAKRVVHMLDGVSSAVDNCVTTLKEARKAERAAKAQLEQMGIVAAYADTVTKSGNPAVLMPYIFHNAKHAYGSEGCGLKRAKECTVSHGKSLGLTEEEVLANLEVPAEFVAEYSKD